MVKHNIFSKPFIVTLRRNGVCVDLVRWAESEKQLREELAMDVSPQIEIVRVKEQRT